MALPRVCAAGPRSSLISVGRVLCLTLLMLLPTLAWAQTGTITGAVGRMSGSTPVPLPGVAVVLSGPEHLSQTTDGSGAYSFTGLPPGRYFLNTENDLGYTNEVYNDILCRPGGGCDATAGTPITLAAGAVATAYFILDLGGVVSGVVSDAATSAPLVDVTVELLDLDTTGSSFVSRTYRAQTDTSGSYRFQGMPAGRYYAYTVNNLGYVDEVYDNVPCPSGCVDQEIFVTTQGAPILVSLGATASGKDFALDRGGRITGTITDAVTTGPLDDACVYAIQVAGEEALVIGGDCVDGAGFYDIGGLQTGAYYLYAFAPDHAPELYDNIPCFEEAWCVSLLASATPTSVTLGSTTAGRNFALSPGGTIHGVVRDAITSAPLPYVPVVLVRRQGGTAVQLDVVYSNDTGEYSATGLPSGTYYAFSWGDRYPNEIYDDIPCPGGECTLEDLATTGTPIVVTDGVVTSGIDFGLRSDVPPRAPAGLSASVGMYGVYLQWFGPYEPGTSYFVEAGLQPGSTIVSLPNADEDIYVSPVGPGRYYVRVRAVNAYGVSPPSEEILVIVASDGSDGAPPQAPYIIEGWMSGSRLTLTWHDSDWGGATPTSYVVEAGSATGVTNITSITVGQRALTFNPVPNGFYFVRVRAVNAAGSSPPSNEVLLNVGNVPAPPYAPWGLEAAVAGSTVTLTWQPPRLGTATSYLVRAGSAPGLSNLAQANTGSGTSAVFSGVPPGTYYVRVHAVNSVGASIASNEVRVVVP
ncbi:MAG: carboxypeptidase regulatory-like domain-containing protein [Vicinamibacterales bacterium]